MRLPSPRTIGLGASRWPLAGGTGRRGTGVRQRAYPPVTAERLLNPADGDWLMIRRTYDGWGYSPLADITPANVGRLKLVWSQPTNIERVHEAAPIVNGGLMFITAPGNIVMALDAVTGAVVWRNQRPRPKGSFVLHDTNRGVALYGDRVYVVAGEAQLVALDARTGKELWAATVADNKSAYYLTMAPLIADGKVLVGASGGEFGVRGFVAAFDLDTGKELWRTFTVPAPGEPGSETWPKGEQWKTGGAPVWVTGNYDPATRIAYFGTGNGGPWMGDQRPGDNLYVASTVAIDVATGRIRGHFQYNPNESWDWDEVSPPIVVDYQRNGRTVKGLVNVARNGYVWFLERFPDRIGFVDGQALRDAERLQEPRPEDGPARRGRRAQAGHRQGGPVLSQPARRQELAAGGVQPEDAADVHPRQQQPVRPDDRRRGALRARTRLHRGAIGDAVPGAGRQPRRRGAGLERGHRPEGVDARLRQDARTGVRCWSPAAAWCSPAAPTTARSTRSMRLLASCCGSTRPVPASSRRRPPSRVNGKQYVAVLAGWGGDPRGMQNALNRIFPGEYPPVPEGGSLSVFALD